MFERRGKPPAYRPLLANPGVLVFAWGATVPMIAHAAGIMLDEIATTRDNWVTPTERKSAKDIIQPGNVAACGSRSTASTRAKTAFSKDAAPDWPSGTENDVYRADIEGTPSVYQETAFQSTDGSGGTRRPRAAWRPARARSTRCPL